MQSINLTHPILHKMEVAKLLENVTVFSSFCKNIEKESRKHVEDRNNVLGDLFELFAEAFNKSFTHYIKDYTVNPRTEDYGIDVYGTGNDNKSAVMQIKYRANTSTYLRRNEDHLGNFLAQGARKPFSVDVNTINNWIVFTNCKGLDHSMSKDAICINGEMIKRFVDNNIYFWQAFKEAVIRCTTFKDETYVDHGNYLSMEPKGGPLLDLYYYQKEAVNVLSSEKRGIVHLPTGTGKTTIIARSIIEHSKNNPDYSGIYAINSPRILLSNQLMLEVKLQLDAAGLPAEYLCINSGKGVYVDEDQETSTETFETSELEKILIKDKKFVDIPSTTKVSEIKRAYEKAVRRKVPLIISPTYHSMPRVEKAGLDIENIYCDEAHNLSNTAFNWIVQPDSNLKYKKMFFFTATTTTSNTGKGLAMDNTHLYGNKIYCKTPAEMVKDGFILPTKLHYAIGDERGGVEVDPSSLRDIFNCHKSQLSTKLGAKLLVICKGTAHLEELYVSESIQLLIEEGVNVCAIRSNKKPRINNEEVSKEEFLERIRSFGNDEEVIIMHVRMLGEGIDIPGITGILPFDTMGLTAFTQNLGRASRLHPEDRKTLAAGKISVEDPSNWVKPDAWVILPNFTKLGEALVSDLEEMTHRLRDRNFSPEENVVYQLNGGEAHSLELLPPTDEVRKFKEKHLNLLHKIEKDNQNVLLRKALYQNEKSFSTSVLLDIFMNAQ